jgi:MYND finger
LPQTILKKINSAILLKDQFVKIVSDGEGDWDEADDFGVLTDKGTMGNHTFETGAFLLPFEYYEVINNIADIMYLLAALLDFYRVQILGIVDSSSIVSSLMYCASCGSDESDDENCDASDKDINSESSDGSNDGGRNEKDDQSEAEGNNYDSNEESSDESDDEHSIMTCSGCLCTYYCSEECQKKHWKAHKAFCVEENKSRTAELEKAAIRQSARMLSRGRFDA